MVKFKKLIVSNYKTIGNAEIHFEPGIYKVVGDNQDSAYVSNGAGKTTILQAIVVGLYNRDLSGVTLEHLNNRTTKKPFAVTVEMDVTNKGTVQQVKIVNDRTDVKKMRVFIDNELKEAGVNNCLPLIESLLGMGFETFKLTHFITSSTITYLTQNLSQPTLFNDILHIIELQELDKLLLAIYKEVQVALVDSSSKLKSLTEQEKLLELKSKYNAEELSESLEVAEQELSTLEYSFGTKSSVMLDNIEVLKAHLSKYEQTIQQLKSSLRNGVCSQCGAIVLDKDSLNTLNKQLLESTDLYDATILEYDSINQKYQLLNKKYIDIKSELSVLINRLKQDMNIAHEITDLHIDTSGNIEHIKEIVETLEAENSFILSARKEIKTGKVIKEILDKFFMVVQLKLSEYAELINLEHFQILVKNDKLGMMIQLSNNGIDIPVDSLSNGEKTRLSLLVLISMLDAMKTVTDAETNYLTIDEAASSLDASGAAEMEKLFSYLKNLGQSVFIITHGKELDKVHYTKQMTVTKNNGVSSIQIGDL